MWVVLSQSRDIRRGTVRTGRRIVIASDRNARAPSVQKHRAQRGGSARRREESTRVTIFLKVPTRTNKCLRHTSRQKRRSSLGAKRKRKVPLYYGTLLVADGSVDPGPSDRLLYECSRLHVIFHPQAITITNKSNRSPFWSTTHGSKALC